MKNVEDLIAAWTDGTDGNLPSVAAEVWTQGECVFTATRGLARRTTETAPERQIDRHQPYDLASLTKALAAAPVAASLIEHGELTLESRPHRWFPEIDPRITVAHLLTHSSGYPAWRPLYEEAAPAAWGTAQTRAILLGAARRTPLEAEPGTQHRYSDLGMLVLLAMFEAATGSNFENLFLERVQLPTGRPDVRWGWPTAAATERCPVRKTLVEGTVHDLNCAAIGGVSTHAGLFGAASTVAHLADRLRAAVADPERFPHLPGQGLATLWALRGAGPHRGGWDSISTGYSSTGRFFPPDTVGHLGYTGTSVWVVPSRQTTVVLLTNRIHPVDDKEPIRRFRPLFHDAVAEALGWPG